MSSTNLPFTLTRARAGRSLAVAAVTDDMDPYYPFCRFCWYDHGDEPGSRWGDDRLDLRTHGMTLFQRSGSQSGRQFVLLSAEGEVVFIQDPRNEIEKIPGAGISGPDSQHWGRMENIRAIGDHLYACGGGGQIYKREDDGTWHSLDPNLLQGSDVPLAQYDIFQRINGPHEDAIYVVGRSGKILFWNGTSFKQVPSDSDCMLIDVLVEREDLIWVCGADGTLLRGNHRDGFRQVPGVDGYWAHLTTMAMHEGRLYLSSEAEGLFTYENDRLNRVLTGLTPELEDIHTVDVSHGILWTVGLKDITRFDGKRWERIDFPGNTPIR